MSASSSSAVEWNQGEEERYSELPYLSLPHPATDPNRLELVGRLHGLQPPDHRTARVLELGCGDGGNLLAIAAAWPGSTCVGIDLTASAVERGSALAQRAGLTNVDLRVGDLLDPDLLGPGEEFDYVLLHGLLTWVPDPVRAAALALTGRVLSPTGLALCDHGAVPGEHGWAAAKGLLRFGAGTRTDPVAAVAAARAALDLALELDLGGDPLHRRVLEEGRASLQGRSAYWVYHDDLNPAYTPFSVADMAGLCAAHDLAYVGEATHGQWWDVDRGLDELVRQVAPTPDPVQRQLVADLVCDPAFKSTVVCRADAVWSRTPLAPAEGVDLVAHATAAFVGQVPDGVSPVARCILDAVADAGPRGASVHAAGAGAGSSPTDAAWAALGLFHYEWITLRRSHPPVATSIADRPVAHRLARAQAELRSAACTTLAHGHVVVGDGLTHDVIRLLDGTREVEALADCLQEAGHGGSRADLGEQAQLVVEELRATGVLAG